MNHGFCIELRPEVSHECAALFVGETVTPFYVTLDRWHRADYVDRWQQELRALVDGADTVLLVAEVPDEPEAVVRGFLCQRKDGDAVVFSRCEFAATVSVDESGVPSDPLQGRTLEVIGTTTLDAIVSFLERTS